MNSVIEKEKKLNLALTQLKKLNLKNPDIKKDLENLSIQKNQLEDFFYFQTSSTNLVKNPFHFEAHVLQLPDL